MGSQELTRRQWYHVVELLRSNGQSDKDIVIALSLDPEFVAKLIHFESVLSEEREQWFNEESFNAQEVIAARLNPWFGAFATGLVILELLRYFIWI